MASCSRLAMRGAAAPEAGADGWKRLLELIERAAEDGREVFAPGRELEWNDWIQIVTLPATISKLKDEAIQQWLRTR